VSVKPGEVQDAVKSRDIIYTFPNINAAWQFVERIETHDPFFVTSAATDFYYDPNSIVTISETRKGFWRKGVLNSTKSISFDGFDRQLQSSEFLYFFNEIDCNSNKIRFKVEFYNDDQNNAKHVLSDFSKEGVWEEYANGSPFGKIANAICSSH
jgi:hypothetical protein